MTGIDTSNIDLETEIWLTITEVAKMFRCSTNTIYRMVDDGDLPAVKLRGTVTRIPKSQLEKAINKLASG